MKSVSRCALILLAPIIFMTILVGCLSPLAIQAVGGAASGAGSSASEYQGGGKGESYFIAHYDDVVQAALKTGETLSLELKEKIVEEERTTLQYSDLKAKRIKLLIEPRTEKMTSIVFDVGWTGSVAFGRLVARQINFELKEAGAFLVDWTPDRFD